jgi:Collagen triple helix repeat (20 copies)
MTATTVERITSSDHSVTITPASGIGDVDLTGVTGPQGAQGHQGSQGSQGLQGSQGNQGAQGTNGNQGVQGTQGPQGVQGAGTQGPQGFQGTQGTQGAQGNQGTQGNQGASGGGGAIGTVQGIGTNSGTDYTTTSTSFVEVDSTNLSKNIAAAANDVLEVTICGTCGGATNLMVFAVGINGTALTPSELISQDGNTHPFSMTIQYVVQAGDITAGNVKVNFMFRAFSAGTANIENGSAHTTSGVPIIAIKNLKH